MNHLDSHNILVEFQHGVRANHSCETQLLSTVEDLSRRLDRRKATDLLILDFSKAFATVPHHRLLHKLQHCGYRKYQQMDRHGCATANSELSLMVQLRRIRQSSLGTVLGPLMFLLYVNDIGAKVSPQTTIKLFADDCLLYRTIDSVADEIQLQPR